MSDILFELCFDGYDNLIFKENRVTSTVNQLPVISPISDITVDEAVESTVTVSASDPDVGQEVVLSLVPLHEGTGVTLNDGVIKITATSEDTLRSPFEVTVIATDSMQGQSQESFVVTVVPIPVESNEPPEIIYPTSQDSFTMYVDEVLQIEVIAEDPEGQPLTYGAETLEGSEVADVSVNGNIITFDPKTTGTVTCTVSVSVTDGSSTAHASFEILVQERDTDPVDPDPENPLEGDIMFRDLWVKIKLGLDGSATDLWMKFFSSKGITSGNVTDAEDQWLTSLGYKGSLLDKRYQFEQDQGIGTGTPSGTTPTPPVDPEEPPTDPEEPPVEPVQTLVHDEVFTLSGSGFGNKTINPRTLLVWRAEDGTAANLTLGMSGFIDNGFSGSLSTERLAPGSTQSARQELNVSSHILGGVWIENSRFYNFRRCLDDFTEEEASAAFVRVSKETLVGSLPSPGDVVSRPGTDVTGVVRKVTEATNSWVFHLEPLGAPYYYSTSAKSPEGVEYRTPFGGTTTPVEWATGSGTVLMENNPQITFNNKIIRIHADVAGTNPYGRKGNAYIGLGKHISKVTVEHVDGNNGISGSFAPNLKYKTKQWVHEEFEFHSSTYATTNGKFAYWQDGVKNYHNGRIMTTGPGYETEMKKLYQHQMSNGAQPEMWRYYDYLYIDEDMCRVLLADGPSLNLNDETANEVKVFPLPIKSWSDDKIEVYYQKYMPNWTHLHVVNSEGQVVKTYLRSEVESGLSGGTSALAWTAPNGLADGEEITLTSDEITFEAPEKMVWLGFGDGWLYNQTDGTPIAQTIPVGTEQFEYEYAPENTQRHVTTVEGLKFLKTVAKPSVDGVIQNKPDAGGCIDWNTGSEIGPDSNAFMYSLRRCVPEIEPGGTFQWKQDRINAYKQLGANQNNSAYITEATTLGTGPRVSAYYGGSGSAAGYSTHAPVHNSKFASFGWLWKPNTPDALDGVMKTFLVEDDTIGAQFYDPQNWAGSKPDYIVQSEATERPQWMKLQDYIGNNGNNGQIPLSGNIEILHTDIFWKKGGGLVMIGDAPTLEQCTTLCPMVPVRSDNPNSITLRLWKQRMPDYSNAHIFVFNDLMELQKTVAL